MDNFFIGLVLILSIISCNPSDAKVNGHFFNTSNSRSSYLNSDKGNRLFNENFVQESFMDFFANGQYSMNINNYEHGTYEFHMDTISLLRSDGHQWTLIFKTENELNHFIFPETKKIVTLKKLENEFTSEYPFIPDYNRWRIGDTESLSNNEMIEKFQNYNNYMIHYMRWAKNNEQNLSFKRLSGPLQFANNGLMMRKLSQTGRWCSYFVEEDCLKMDNILRNYFDGLIIDWKYTNDRVSMLIDALNQVNKGIENHKQNFNG